MPGDLLDLILIALIAAFAVAGYRQGFIIGILSLAGFVVGVIGGAVIAPGISRAFAKSVPWQAFIAILVVFATAVIGMLVASGLGVAVRSRLTGRPATVVDSLGGAAVNIVAVLIVAWLIGSFVVTRRSRRRRQVNDSLVLRSRGRRDAARRSVPAGLPAAAQPASNGLYSQVFSAIGAEVEPEPARANQACSNRARASPRPSRASSRSRVSRRRARCRSRAPAS